MNLYIRQTPYWEQYFNLLGWKSFRLKNKALVVYYKNPFFSFGKMQRPYKLNKSDIEELDTLCKKNKFLFLKLEPNIEQDLSILEKNGFKKSAEPLSPTITMEIDLTLPVDTLWNNLTKSGKYGVTRGRKDITKVDFIENPTEEQLEDYFRKVQLYTANSMGFYTPSFKDMLLKRKPFGKGNVLSLVFDKDNNLAGGKFYLLYKDVSLYLTGGTTEIGRHNRSGFVQMWESILYFKKLGYKKLDLDGMYDPKFSRFTRKWKGFSMFKEKFGGNIRHYPDPYIKYYSPILDMLSKIIPLDL